MNDGLPSSQVYQAIEDDRSIMWFATDRGLVRFDGYEFQVFTTKDGLGSNVIFGFHKGYDNKIWFYLYNGGIGYIEEDKVSIPKFNELIKDKLKKAIITSMYVGKDNTISLVSRNGYYNFKYNSKQELVHASDWNFYYYSHMCLVDSLMYMFDSTSTPIKQQDSMIKIGIKESIVQRFPNYKIPEISHRTDLIKTERGIFGVQNDLIFQMVDTSIVQLNILPGIATFSIFEDRRSNIWVGTERQGAFCFKNGDLQSTPQQFLSNYNVTSVCEDIYGGMWFTTWDAGVFYLRNLNVQSFKYGNKYHSESISTMCVYDSMLWVGTNNGSIFRQETSRKSRPKLIYKDFGKIFSIQRSKDELFIRSAIRIPEQQLLIPKVNYSSKIIVTTTLSDTVWTYGRLEDPDISPFELYLPRKIGSRIECIFYWKNKVFTGTQEGLFYLKNDNSWELYPLPFNPWIIDVTTSESSIYMATKEHGILINDGENNHYINKDNGILANHIRTIAIDKNQNLWIGTKKGINKIALNKKNEVINITEITDADGLISNEVNQILYQDEQIWVATNEGISQFNSNQTFNNPLSPPIYLTSLGVNQAYKEFSIANEFDHMSKAFNFKFAGINYPGNGLTKYKYRLKGFDGKWNETYDREARYMLSPGNYIFEVMAQSSYGVWSQNPANYNFTINAPIWQRWWFLTLVICTFCALAFYLFNNRINALKKEASLKVKMAESQHQALSAQLKPHFVFNAINSIHNYIRKNDKEKSSEYLILFSKLIRQVLANSNEHLISIEQELQLVNKYLQIEQLRFKEKLTYSLKVDDQIDVERMKIPTQLIQPYVENAIWHGLMHKEEPGHVSIKINQLENQLHCVIEDNGVGRKLAKKNTNNSHKSSGMTINIQRLKLVEVIFKRPVKLIIEDLKNELGEPSGTRVNLTIPIINS